MDVRVDDAGGCRKRMSVSVPAASVTPDYEEVLTAYRRHAKVPGFRPGKAPRDVVERHYAASVVDDAKNRLIPKLYQDALTQAKITPVSLLGVSDVTFDKVAGLSFNVTIDVPPEFKLPKYKRLTVKRQDVAVEEKDISEALTHMRERLARYEDVTERTVVMAGDLVRADFSGAIAGQPLKNVVPDAAQLAEGTDFWMQAGTPEFVPGVAAALQGAALGATIRFAAAFPADFRVKSLAGRTVDYTVTVKAIRERKLPPVDDAFLARFKADSEPALREQIRVDLLKHREEEERRRMRADVSTQLLEKADFDIPESLVAQETRSIARDLVQRMAMGGVTREQIEANTEDLVKRSEQAARDRVRLTYILDRIAEEESITVTDEDVEKRIAELADQYGMPVERLRSEIERRDNLEQVRRELLADRAMDVVMEEAKVKKA